MARYGEEFHGRYNWRSGPDQGGYDRGFRGGWNQTWGQARNAHGGFGGGSGWGTPSAGRGGELNESWSSMGHGRGRSDFGSGSGYGRNDFSRNDFGRNDFGRSYFGDEGRGGSTSWGRHGQLEPMSRYEAGREFGGGPYRSGRVGHDYDDGFSERIRRGWNRLRDEARDWMGRGYDRGW